VQQRFQLSGLREIAAFAPKQDVGGEQVRRYQRLAKGRELAGVHPKKGEGQTAQDDEEQRRKEAPSSALVEGHNRKTVLFDFAIDQIGN